MHGRCEKHIGAGKGVDGLKFRTSIDECGWYGRRGVFSCTVPAMVMPTMVAPAMFVPCLPTPIVLDAG